MYNSMNERGCGCSGHVDHEHHHHHHHCGDQCFSLGPFRATSTKCPPRNTGSIIPFSSGITAVTLSSAAEATSTVSAIGFGTAVNGIPVSNNTITLPLGTTTEAFNVPRSGTVSAISATFTVIAPATVPTGATATITARIYRAPAGSSLFTATNAFVNLMPNLTGSVVTGAVFQGTVSTDVPVSAGDRLVMVFSIARTGTTSTVSVTGTATAGITVS